MGGTSSSLIKVAARTSSGGTINPETQQFEPSAVYALAILAVSLLNVWISYALATNYKRLHDRDRTGWWLLVQLLTIVVAGD
jgi:uncharacterized membrane protein YhaH (DUF805 family)